MKRLGRKATAKETIEAYLATCYCYCDCATTYARYNFSNTERIDVTSTGVSS